VEKRSEMVGLDLETERSDALRKDSG
jgi:hypothetical protein